MCVVCFSKENFTFWFSTSSDAFYSMKLAKLQAFLDKPLFVQNIFRITKKADVKDRENNIIKDLSPIFLSKLGLAKVNSVWAFLWALRDALLMFYRTTT